MELNDNYASFVATDNNQVVGFIGLLISFTNKMGMSKNHMDFLKISDCCFTLQNK